MTVFGTLEPVAEYAPNTHVRPGAPPVFLALGLNDAWVYIDHGTVFMRSLATAKVPSALVYVPSGHEGTVRLPPRED